MQNVGILMMWLNFLQIIFLLLEKLCRLWSLSLPFVTEQKCLNNILIKFFRALHMNAFFPNMEGLFMDIGLYAFLQTSNACMY